MPRIRAELRDAGVVASRKRIARLMRANGLRGVSHRRGLTMTTERNRRERPAPDLGNHRFVADETDQLWVSPLDKVKYTVVPCP